MHFIQGKDTVESYDVFADEWKPMPNMVKAKYGHDLAVVKDKMYVIECGHGNCEVFDYHSEKFVAFKKPCEFNLIGALAIGNELVVIQ